MKILRALKLLYVQVLVAAILGVVVGLIWAQQSHAATPGDPAVQAFSIGDLQGREHGERDVHRRDLGLYDLPQWHGHVDRLLTAIR